MILIHLCCIIFFFKIPNTLFTLGKILISFSKAAVSGFVNITHLTYNVLYIIKKNCKIIGQYVTDMAIQLSTCKYVNKCTSNFKLCSNWLFNGTTF